MKVMVIVGTRPEVIKMAPVISALRERKINTVVCASGQHREMLKQALDVFAIVPDISLDVMAPDQSLNTLSARLLQAIDQALLQEQPDWVLVQGDTTTALCGGLAAFHRNVAVGHIEAGLRTGDLTSPFPEEANRSMLARIATLHFAPTQAARQALMREGIPANQIVVTGNTVVDAIGMVRPMTTGPLATRRLESLWHFREGSPLVLVTCHRRENFGGPLEAICQMLRRMCQRYSGYQWVFPVHLNPHVQEPVRKILADLPNICLLEPVDYITNLSIIARASLVVSDSGGIQEEAPSFGVPVVVMRNHTERVEGVSAGFATLAGQDVTVIEKSVCAWLDDASSRETLRDRKNPYGDGLAAQRIVTKLAGTENMAEFHG